MALTRSTQPDGSTPRRSSPGRRLARQAVGYSRRLLTKIVTNKTGATVIEYALIAAIISVVIISATGAIGEQLRVWGGDVQAGLSANTP